ncbi:unnamed protein product [Orchesella dallaii]|uniref:Uncharacterized protein n=1 Tax=Orchesella dallaii TaxID=48710 RepID=A0ABP1R9L4_9HEXA
MDAQNVDRRDSKKSNGKNGGGNKGQGRGNGNSNTGSNTNNGGKSGSGEKQRSHSQGKSKSYREREIYKPPSLRSSKNRNSNSTSEQQNSKGNSDDASVSANQSQPKRSNSINSAQQKNAGISGNNNGSSQNGNYNEGIDSSNMMSNNGYSLFGNGNGNNGSSSVPSSPLISNRMQNNFNGAAAAAFGLANRMYNVNAKEFQLLSQNALHQHQQQQQQLSNFLSQFDPTVFYNNSPILASSGCYPLKQSKSSGNMNLLLQQQQHQQQQAAAFQQLQSAMGFNFPLQQPGSFPAGNNGGNGTTNGNGQFNRLSQSKSSGNVPGNGAKPRVRFDDEEPDFDDDDLGQQLGNYFASLKLNGDLAGAPQAANFPKSYAFQQQPQQQQPKVPLSPQPVLKSALQKSRTGFYLNLYGNQQQQPQTSSPSLIPSSPTKSVYGLSNAGSAPFAQQRGQSFNASKLGSGGGTGINPSNYPSVVKRSRSFGPGTHHLPRTSATTLLSATTAPSSASHSVYSDFCITKWPKVVQELVTAAVTGVERIPARNWIEMVNRIFEAMLCDFKPSKKERENDNQASGMRPSGGGESAGSTSGDGQSTSLEASGESLNKSAGSVKDVNDVANGGGNNNGSAENDDDYDEDDDEDDLAVAAVHIFLYFIQREKDRTVMESLLNTCFASFQRLASSSITTNAAVKPKSQQQTCMMAGKPPISRQWSNFLRFLSTLYAQVKLIRRQKQSQQQTGHSMDEMSFSLLALLCDSCLATLRSPQSYTAEMMGCLFTVLTSIGRDMEGTFPLKMKQLLAAVRDALLGIGPYHQQQHHNGNSSAATSKFSGVSPIVQKTLMQLIELHACNWQLPASAVRYYYSSVSKSSTSSTNTSNNNNNNAVSSASHASNAQTQQMNTSNNSNSPSHPSKSVLPASSSPTAVTNDNNDDGATVTVNSNNSGDSEQESSTALASLSSHVTQPTSVSTSEKE